MYTLLMGVQDFVQLRQNNLLYLDEITRLLELIENGRRYFLLRPCRFGKSFTFLTLDARFRGCKELLKVLSVKVSLSPILLVSAGRILAHRIHFMRRIL